MFQISTYVYGESALHKADARAKFAVLFVCTLVTFFVSIWGLLVLVALSCVAALCAKVPFRYYKPFLGFMAVLMVFAVLFNCFDAKWPDIYLWGSFGVSFGGMLLGVFYALRILVLMLASLVFCFTTSAEEMIAALRWYMKPLRAIRVPVDDVAMVLSLALRFIPLVGEEVQMVSRAQQARGSALSSGTYVQRIRAWVNVFIPLFVRLFKKAEDVGTAMDARCYGLKSKQERNNFQ